ncbi:MAG: hypothetical protein GTO02_03545, partial [Candidatus Dadabacteria bacterium]|nr:hypothetical protein [Candidatus Dadabacteria bacterium]
MYIKNFNLVSSEKSYEKVEFVNSKTGEKKKFTDFDKIDRAIFILKNCDLFSHQMEDLYGKWKIELEDAD